MRNKEKEASASSIVPYIQNTPNRRSMHSLSLSHAKHPSHPLGHFWKSNPCTPETKVTVRLYVSTETHSACVSSPSQPISLVSTCATGPQGGRGVFNVDIWGRLSARSYCLSHQATSIEDEHRSTPHSPSAIIPSQLAVRCPLSGW